MYEIALVWAWLAENPEYYCSWVAPYVQMRFDRGSEKHIVTRVHGHWRRMDGWGGVLQKLACVCRFEKLVVPKGIGAPVRAVRMKWDEEGRIIPHKYRVLVWG